MPKVTAEDRALDKAGTALQDPYEMVLTLVDPRDLHRSKVPLVAEWPHLVYIPPGAEVITAGGHVFHQEGHHDQSTHGSRGAGFHSMDEYFGDGSQDTLRVNSDKIYGGTFGHGEHQLDAAVDTLGVTHRVDGGRSVRMTGHFTDKDGRVQGTFTRHIKQDADGTISVHHSTLDIHESHQGHGIGHEFNEHAYSSYREMGVSHVTVYATDVGQYTWASAGFEFASKHTASTTTNEWLRHAEHSARTDSEKAHLQTLRDRFTHGEHGKVGGWPTALELSQAGRTPGAKHWYGKDAMLAMRTGWDGVLFMS